MGVRHAKELRRIGRAAAAAILALTLASCASGGARTDYQPAPGSYFTVPVRNGDRLDTVAERYQVGEDDLIAINDIDNRDAPLRIKSIRVPAYGHLKDQRQEGPRLARVRNAPVDSRPLVAPKSERGGRNAGKGSEAKGAGKGPRPAEKETKTAAKGDMGSKTAKETAGAKPVKTAENTQDKKPAAEPAWWDVFSSRQGGQSASAGNSRSFLWPVKGRLISAFGTGQGGERNDGINISTPRGTPVRAADGGTVTYVGNELKGYGNLVLIKHDSGYVTAYAHSDTVAVARGDRVSRGQIIAYAGATGDVTQPQLHFEIRLNTKPVDPAPYLVASN
jgi:murein DD-endopeptidase MepM/ murein hydrolase activator NlpD